MNKNIYSALFILIAIYGFFRIYQHFFIQKREPVSVVKIEANTHKVVSQDSVPNSSDALPFFEHKPLSFDLSGKLKGLSTKQIEEHEQLYRGYVTKRNEIAQQLASADRSKANNVTNSPYRGLKLAETFAMNGDILHRLYFQNLTPKSTTIGENTAQLIKENFGSLEAYKADLFAAAQSARGWAITGYALDDGRVYNFVLDTHNQMVPMLVIPLVVLDVYEHAYMIDFGIKRVPYLDVFWQALDWDIIEKRIEFVKKHADLFATYFE